MASSSGENNPDSPPTSGELESADPFRRAKVTLQLGRYADPQALDQLLALLADPEWIVIKAALQSLRRYRDPRIVPAVQAVAGRSDDFLGFTRDAAISRAVTHVLRSQGEAVFQALLTMLREFQDDEIWGQAVVWQLAVLHDPRAIEPLIESFDSPVFEVANRAAAMMRHFGADAIPPLIAALSIMDQSVYFQVSWALRWIGAPAVPALLDALRHATDADIRSGAAYVLDRADGNEVREALHDALNDPAENVRRMAMWSLGCLGDPRALEFLLAEEPDPRPGSSDPGRTLAEIGDAAVTPLIAALEDRKRLAYQRMNAARALGLIADKRAVEPLIAALRDDDEDMRVAAIDALGDLKDARAVEPLLAALQDSSPEVRRRAAGELASIEDDRAFDAVVRYVREGGANARSEMSLLYTLAQHHRERALPFLHEMALGDDRQIWYGAASTLSLLGAVPVLLEIARDPLPERRYGAISWLKLAYRRSPDPRIVEFLYGIIQETPASDIDRAMHYQATMALAECGDPRAVEPLLAILQNPASHSMSIQQAAQLLGMLGDGDERALAALEAAYKASKAGDDGADGGHQQLWRRNEFQDALLRAMAKIRARLGVTSADEDSSGASTAT